MSPEVTRIGTFLRFFCVFFGKRPLMIKFSKFCSESLHRDTDRRCCVQNSWKSVNSCVIYLTKKIFGSLSNCHFCTDRAKNLPWPAPNIWLTTFQIFLILNRFTFGRVMASRVKAVKTRLKVSKYSREAVASH